MYGQPFAWRSLNAPIAEIPNDSYDAGPSRVWANVRIRATHPNSNHVYYFYMSDTDPSIDGGQMVMEIYSNETDALDPLVSPLFDSTSQGPAETIYKYRQVGQQNFGYYPVYDMEADGLSTSYMPAVYVLTVMRTTL
jgi:hypothetical protein